MARRIAGTEDFTRLARDLKAAGTTGKGLRRELGKALRKGTAPLVDEARRNVQGLEVRGVRGGASARAARAARALGKRKRVTDKARMRAHRGSGLRATVARSVSATVDTGGATARLRVRAAQAKMPPDQRKLPRYLNRGSWRHPVFGRDPWVEQTAPPAWFDDAGARKGPQVRDNAVQVVGEYLGKLL
ncbi:MAG: hypothetical protein K0Q93_2139 [Nocardioidaceae bacterium]|nr:hypothetical protein [Nocardioidaceae bacterium]